MTEIQSDSEKQARGLGNFFRPGEAEVMLYFLLSLIILTAFSFASVAQKLGINYLGAPEKLSANFNTLFDNFSNAFSTAFGGRLAQIIIWAALGAIVYVGLWLSRNVLNSFENDIISDRYLHPTGYSRAGYWASSLSVKIMLLASVFIFLAFLLICVKAVVPSVATLAGSAVYHFNWRTSLLYIVFAIVGVMLLIYLTVRLARLLVRLWHLI